MKTFEKVQQFCEIPQIINDASSGEDQCQLRCSQKNKPNNKNYFIDSSLVYDSKFPAGNLQTIQSKVLKQRPEIINIQFQGTSDKQVDQRDKSWFYFTIAGFDRTEYTTLYLKWLNANMYRKYVREKKYKPYIMIRQYTKQECKNWKALLVDNINVVQNEKIQAEFTYFIDPEISKIQLAANLPYNLSNLQKLHQRVTQSLYLRGKHVYSHRQIITQSPDDLPVYLYTITSVNNILSYTQHQAEICSHNSIRPHKLKNRPEIVFVGRVHPSQISSSWFIEGIIQNLIDNPEMQMLLNIFIFRIFPMVNPDGVENGNYRLDSFLQNLNRFYGRSNLQKSPSIYAVEKLIQRLRDKSRLFMFVDVHGHTSPKPSFIYGNYNTNLFQSIENRTFCKILQSLNQGYFQYVSCEFSKRNMSIKQKYDEYSKQNCGRVFAYRGNSQQDNLQTNLRNFYFVQHSYTLQVLPFIVNSQKKCFRKNFSRIQKSNSSNNLKNSLPLTKTQSQTTTTEPSLQQIMNSYFFQGQMFLCSIMQLLGIQAIDDKTKGKEDLPNNYRRLVHRQLIKIPQFFMNDRSKRFMTKQVDYNCIQQYLSKWQLGLGFEDYINSSQQNRKKYQKCLFGSVILQSKQKIQKNLTNKVNNRNSYNSQKKQYSQRPSQPKQIHKININESNPQNQVNINNSAQKPVQNIKNSYKIRHIQFADMLYPSNDTQYNIQEKSKLSSKTKVSYKNQEMEDRIRKLIFRHKTENGPENTIHYKNSRMQTQIGYECVRQNHNLISKQSQNEIFNSKRASPDFDDANLLNKLSTKNQKVDIQYPFRFQIQDTIKKVKKRQRNTIEANQYERQHRNKHQPIHTSKKKKHLSRGKIFDSQKIFIGPSNQTYGTMSNNLLPPVSGCSNPSADNVLSIYHDKQFIYRSKLHGLKNNQSKKRVQTQTNRNRQQNLNDIVNNFRRISKNNSNKVQLMTSAKQIIVCRKKYQNGIQQKKLIKDIKQTNNYCQILMKNEVSQI